MKVLKEDISTHAWMIRNDGKEFPVEVHKYGNREIEYIEETIDAAQWLYDATRHPDVRDNVIKLIASFAEMKRDENGGDRIDILFRSIANVGYRFLSPGFVNKHEKEILDSDVVSGEDLKELNILICNELDQEFLRARFGGMYNTKSSSAEMFFRVSSTGFNWINIIYNFVANRRNIIRSVTIVRDDEYGQDFQYFYAYKGQSYNNLPISEFLTQSGNPVIESISDMKEEGLLLGKSINENFKNMNIGRKNQKFSLLHDKESTRYK